MLPNTTASINEATDVVAAMKRSDRWFLQLSQLLQVLKDCSSRMVGCGGSTS